MIGQLRGKLLEKHPPQIIVDVNGIGYEVEVPMSTFFVLPEQNEKVSLQTHLLVREDAQLLYGFADKKEKQLFRTLIKISGVGAKMALAILSGMGIDEFANAINSSDVTQLTKIPGVGKKTAERLIIEMKDKLISKSSVTNSQSNMQSNDLATNTSNNKDEAIGALESLGYKPKEAEKMVNTVVKNDERDTFTVEELIKKSLQNTIK